MSTISALDAIEILDSRGRPTVAATCVLASGARATASVPSGASTGSGEAVELRDGDPRRHRGFGCRAAAANVRGPIAAALVGREVDQAALDAALIAVDGSADKSRLGANALLATSLAFARAAAQERAQPLYRYFADLAGVSAPRLPRPTVNLFSGGKHAGGQVAIQDVLIVPLTATTMDDALADVCAVYHAAAELMRQRYGARALVADEGGLAPPFPTADAMLADAVDAIAAAGLRPGVDVALAVDAAATHFHADGVYELDGRRHDASAMIETLAGKVARYPIVSLEDGLAEDDWANWPRLCARLSDRVLVLGDDLLCTNPTRIARAIDARAATALLLKVNQIGTLSEAGRARSLAAAAGWQVTVSARSGETEDDWLADLAVGWRGDQIKIGSITRSERLAKYNRLLAIEAQAGLPLAPWVGRASSAGR